jgi:hypothetical protein
MRSSLGRGLLLTAFAGTFMLAAGPAALAATTPATTSPEAISLDATGTIPIGPVGDATLSNTNPVTGASGLVTGLLGIGAFTDNVQTNAAPPGNTATSTVASVAPAANGLLGGLTGPLSSLLSATVVKSECDWNSTPAASPAFTETTTIASLSILGTTIVLPNPIPPNDVLVGLPTLPLGLASLTVTLNQQEPGPGTNTQTVNAIDVSLSTSILGLNPVTEDVVIASSTCGNPSSVVASPVASGKGLGIGLGLMGLLGTGVATMYVRRRRQASFA